MKTIYGLGNPGRRYRYTRHNIGYMVVDLLCSRWRIFPGRKAAGMVYGKGRIEGCDVMLAKPCTYMNLSGNPLGALGIRDRDLVCVYDDMDLSFGQLRLRKGGSAAGHRGVQSVMDGIGGKDFMRIRCGIGRPEQGEDPVAYVLGGFAQDKDVLRGYINRACDAVESCILDGPDLAMNAFNRRDSHNLNI
ncbi:MAG: aminoacyl-tRNA hydrolase [Thermodesulfobacteriota bacterium]|nr:aminoacyl-tRNA hydrolase [Thermodesulfobacteriota bacterium]